MSNLKMLRYAREKRIDDFEEETLNVLRSAVTAGAMAAVYGIGEEDPNLMDSLAMESIENILNRKLDTIATVVCGEGDMDEAPHFPVGYTFGREVPGVPKLQLVIDPVDGSSSAAVSGGGALVAIAGALEGEGSLCQMPECYALKAGFGRKLQTIRATAPKGTKYDFGRFGTFIPEMPVLLQPLSALVRYASEMLEKTVIVEMLHRPRHDRYAEEIRNAGGKIRFIQHGDIATMLRVISSQHNVDIAYGIGGGPEGVLTAGVASCDRAHFEQKHWVEGDPTRHQKLVDAGINPDQLLSIDGKGDGWLVQGHVFFALGVLTRTDEHPGTSFAQKQDIECRTIYGRSRTHTIKFLDSVHLDPPPVPECIAHRW